MTRTYHVDAAVLTVVDLIVSHYRVAVGADLYPRECVAVDVVVLYETAALAKDVHSTLVAIVNLIFPANTVVMSRSWRRTINEYTEHNNGSISCRQRTSDLTEQ